MYTQEIKNRQKYKWNKNVDIINGNIIVTITISI